MSYQAEIISIEWKLPSKHYTACLQAIKDYVKSSLADSGFKNRIQNISILEDAFDEFGWEMVPSNHGYNIFSYGYITNPGLCEDFFDVVAPFVEKGSYIEMRGEDGTHWIWEFDGNSCTESYATSVWNIQPGIESFNKFVSNGSLPSANKAVIELELEKAQALLIKLHTYIVKLDSAYEKAL